MTKTVTLQSSAANGRSIHLRRRLMASGAIAACAIALLLRPEGALAQTTVATGAYEGVPTVIDPLSATVTRSLNQDFIAINGAEAIINWTPYDRTGNGPIDFLPNGRSVFYSGLVNFTVLNRIIPLNGQDVPVARLIQLNGQIQSSVGNSAAPGSGGSVWFYTPGGILVGSGALINVGSLVLSTRDIDTTGGLFGANGEIRFRSPGIAGSDTASITIDPTASISTAQAIAGSSYVALVAPRIVQQGTISSDGSVALVAAEEADIRINQGLFDINVRVGTSDGNGIVHSGTTGGPAATASDYSSRVYMVAVPKNQALTMLLSGTMGFETATSATVTASGGIVLSAGRNIANGEIDAAAGTGANSTAGMIIDGSRFINDVTGGATDDIRVETVAGSVNFERDVTLKGDRSVVVSATNDQRIDVTGNMLLASSRGASGGLVDVSAASYGSLSVGGVLTADASGFGAVGSADGSATGGTVHLRASDFGTITAGSVDLNANAFAQSNTSGQGGAATAGLINVTLSSGGLLATDLLSASADGFGGGTSSTTTGGSGTGGSIHLDVGGTSLNTSGIFISASGLGGFGSAASGHGQGGAISFITSTDGAINASNVSLYADGTGGSANFDAGRYSQQGGNGTGGTINVLLNSVLGSSLNSVWLSATGTGGDADAIDATAFIRGGNALGGQVSLNHANGAFSTANLIMVANAAGGNALRPGGIGGTARGGSSSLNLRSAELFSASESLFVIANATGGFGTGQSGNATGGRATMLTEIGATAELVDVLVSAEGRGGGNSAEVSATPQTTLVGGNGYGGVAKINNAGTVTAGHVTLSTAGIGGNAYSPDMTVTGGRGAGGTSEFMAQGGSFTLNSATPAFTLLTIRADGTGGSGTLGGDGDGGLIDVTIDGGLVSAPAVHLLAEGRTRGSADLLASATARGGRINMLIGAAAGSIFRFDNFHAHASGIGDASSAFGGNAIGGTASLTNNGGQIIGTSMSLYAGGEGGIGGAGRGGIVTFTMAAGEHAVDVTTFSADGIGGNTNVGDGGRGTGGSISLRFLAGTVLGQNLYAYARGSGGGGGQSYLASSGIVPAGNGGIGQGGQINGQIEGGAAIDLTVLTMDSSGYGGFGGTHDMRLPGGALIGRGGNAYGGTADFSALGGSINSTVLYQFVNARGGVGGHLSSANAITAGAVGSPDADGTGGDAYGGRASVRLHAAIGGIFSIHSAAFGGVGGSGFDGHRGGNASGGISELIVENADVGQLNVQLRSFGEGGAGGNGNQGLGGDGGNGTGGIARLAVNSPNGLATIGDNGVDVTGVGGHGGHGGQFESTANGFDGGMGGVGTGGTIHLIAHDGGGITISDAGGQFLALGFGGAGGNGSNNNIGSADIATFGGNGGLGGSASGGRILFTADGGTIATTATYRFLLMPAQGLRGSGGLGGLGTVTTTVDPVTGNPIVNGGNGTDAAGGSGTVGGLIRLSATSFGGLNGLISLPATHLDVGSDVAGRIELLDKTAGAGLRFTSLFASALGLAQSAGPDFALSGSGIYVESSDGSIEVVESAEFGTSRAPAVSAGQMFIKAISGPTFAASGGLKVGGTFTFSGSAIAGTHVGNPDRDHLNATLDAAAIILNSTGAGIALDASTLLRARDQIKLNAGDAGLEANVRFGGLRSLGTIDISGASIIGNQARAAGDFSAVSSNDVSMSLVDAGTIGMRAGTSLFVVAFNTSVGGAAFVSGGNMTLDQGASAAGLSGTSAGGDIRLGAHSARGSATFGAAGTLMIDSLSTSNASTGSGLLSLSSGGGLLIGTLSSGDGITIRSASVGGASSSLQARSLIDIASAGPVQFGTLDAGSAMIVSGDGLTFTRSSTSGSTSLSARGIIGSQLISTGASVTANAGPGGTRVDLLQASAGASLTSAGALAIGNLIVGNGDALINGQGTVAVDAATVSYILDIRAMGNSTLGTARAGTIQMRTPAAITAGSLTTTGLIQSPGALAGQPGDIQLIAGSSVDLGTLNAAAGIVIRGGTLTGTASSLTAVNNVDIGTSGTSVLGTIDAANALLATGALTFGRITTSGNIGINATGAINGNLTETTGPTSVLNAAGSSVTIAQIIASGNANLVANSGALAVAALASAGRISASGNSVTIGGSSNLDFSTLVATGGDATVNLSTGALRVRSANASAGLNLTARNGSIVLDGANAAAITINAGPSVSLLGPVTATGTLAITAAGNVGVNGVASGQTVRISSGNISINSTGRIGTTGSTGLVELVNNDSTARTFIGGEDTASGYSLSATELLRIFGDNITIRGPRAQTQGAANLGSSRPADIVIGAFTFNGGTAGAGNLGSGGTLTIETQGKIRVTGAVQLNAMSPTNRLLLSGSEAIEVILGQGSIRLTNGASRGGILSLRSDDIVVATAAAIADIATATTASAVESRLAQNDGTVSDEGALSAGELRLSLQQGLYIQNSGTGDRFADRRGFTADRLFIDTAGSSNRIIINGRVMDSNGLLQSGLDAISLIAINGSPADRSAASGSGFDPVSTINGCAIVRAASCALGPTLPPVQDVVGEVLDDDDPEDTGATADDSQDVNVLINIRDVESLPNQPLVDDPVTGTGNDDLWTAPGQ